jgi:2-polyprenyl-3-methyl-5-hydroxy-6-metoxy-1,4-benzoquinol methylase
MMADENYKEISNAGERVTHLYPNDCFYAHLSIYYFSTQFCQNRSVLDAGSGSGYGSAYLADHGAKFVDAIEINKVSVAFSNQHFKKPNLRYQVMDLNDLVGFQPQSFDIIFTSNVLNTCQV